LIQTIGFSARPAVDFFFARKAETIDESKENEMGLFNWKRKATLTGLSKTCG
jgi:hypothetical protein